jgi:hypothetical protein
VYEAEPAFVAALLSGKSVPETLCGWTGSFHDQVTVPPGATLTALGLQKKRTVPVAPTNALIGFPPAGAGVAVGAGGWVATGVFAAGGLVAVGGAAVGVAASALGDGLAAPVGDGALLGAAVGEAAPAAVATVVATAVAEAVTWVGVGSLFESAPPQAASHTAARARVIDSGSPRMVRPPEIRANGVSNLAPVGSESGTSRVAIAPAMATRHAVVSARC